MPGLLRQKCLRCEWLVTQRRVFVVRVVFHAPPLRQNLCVLSQVKDLPIQELIAQDISSPRPESSASARLRPCADSVVFLAIAALPGMPGAHRTSTSPGRVRGHTDGAPGLRFPQCPSGSACPASSALYLLIVMTSFSSKWIFSHPLGTKKRRLVFTRPNSQPAKTRYWSASRLVEESRLR
jgi:hypothetical protein